VPVKPQPPATPPPTALPVLPTLPVLGGAPTERLDAARNRARILAATERLVARQGVDETSLDQIAAEAGVGKGTLFRRFGSRSVLLRSLLSDREAELQEQVIRGEAPLGPGAPARERLLAWGPAYLSFLATHGPLLRAADHSGAGLRYQSAPYAFWWTHVRHLVAEADPALDAGLVADALLASLSAELVLFQLVEREATLERLADAWAQLVGRLLPG
jgi:AcrR family transcriptional regulator